MSWHPFGVREDWGTLSSGGVAALNHRLQAGIPSGWGLPIAAATKAEPIDPALKAAGWVVVEVSKILREYPLTPGCLEGYGRRGQPLIADYALVYRNRKLARPS